MNGTAALLTVALPATAAVLGLPLGRRSRAWGQEWAVLGAFGCFVAAVVEAYGVLSGGAVDRIGFLGRVDTGVAVLHLELRSDQLSALVSLAVGLVAFCVQVYSTAYLHGEGRRGADPLPRLRRHGVPVHRGHDARGARRRPGAAAIGWEGMGICSYLLVGHHSERATARAAAVKAFLVTRVGDLGAMIAVIVLIADAGTTSIHQLLAPAETLGTAPPSPRPPCCCWPASPASRRSSRCTPGCRTRWRARPRSPP